MAVIVRHICGELKLDNTGHWHYQFVRSVIDRINIEHWISRVVSFTRWLVLPARPVHFLLLNSAEITSGSVAFEPVRTGSQKTGAHRDYWFMKSVPSSHRTCDWTLVKFT